MNNKVIFRAYQIACETLKREKSEENMQKYLIIYNELDSLLNKQFEKNMHAFSYSSYNLSEEINRVSHIINLIKNRQKRKDKMLNDHKYYIGYSKMENNNILLAESNYTSYLYSLMKAQKLVNEYQDLKNNQCPNRVLEEKEIESLNTIKKDKNLFLALYNYSLNCQKNKENAFITLLLLRVSS